MLGPYELGKVHRAGAAEGLRTLPAGSVQTIVTSPPEINKALEQKKGKEGNMSHCPKCGAPEELRTRPTEDPYCNDACECAGKMAKRIARTYPFIKKLKAECKEFNSVLQAKCPECGKQLNYRVSSYNKHIAIKCPTEGCLNFRE